MAIADWSTVAADNDTTLGINIAEGCPAANVNNAMRKMMADVATGINFSLLGTFLASTSLSQAQSALGVGAGSTSATNFDALTNAANKVPYMTGSNNWSTTDFTSFGRSVVACGDASALNTLLGSSGGSGGTFSGTASSGYVTFTLGATTFRLQWKDFTATGNTTTAVTYPTAFSSWSRAWVNPNASDTDADQNFSVVQSSSTTGATVMTAYSVSPTTSCTLFAIGV